MNAKHTPKQCAEIEPRKSLWKKILEKLYAYSEIIDYDPLIDSSQRFDYLANRLDEIETRLVALEGGIHRHES